MKFLIFVFYLLFFGMTVYSQTDDNAKCYVDAGTMPGSLGLPTKSTGKSEFLKY